MKFLRVKCFQGVIELCKIDLKPLTFVKQLWFRVEVMSGSKNDSQESLPQLATKLQMVARKKLGLATSKTPLVLVSGASNMDERWKEEQENLLSLKTHSQ